MPEFVPWPKIPRWNRGIVVTEKIDGTNACVIVEAGKVFAQSRKRLITPDKDNYGFGAWCAEHEEELLALGNGHHFGEWYGLGIQRGYGLDHKRFALFNVLRWSAGRPACCDVVPELYSGALEQEYIDECVAELRHRGSYAVPGFKPAEGVVIFHIASRTSYKITLEGDDAPKSTQ